MTALTRLKSDSGLKNSTLSENVKYLKKTNLILFSIYFDPLNRFLVLPSFKINLLTLKRPFFGEKDPILAILTLILANLNIKVILRCFSTNYDPRDQFTVVSKFKSGEILINPVF